TTCLSGTCRAARAHGLRSSADRRTRRDSVENQREPRGAFPRARIKHGQGQEFQRISRAVPFAQVLSRAGKLPAPGCALVCTRKEHAMRRSWWRVRVPVLLAVLVLSGLTAGRAADDFKVEDGYTSLFNGQDLTGWRYPGPKGEVLDGKTETPDKRIQVV